MGKSLWSIEGVPIKVTWVKVIWSNPIKMNGIDEKWVNRVDRTIWGEMSELKEVTWNNPMGKSLWVERGEPYGSDWNEPYEKVPIKMNGIDEKWMNWVKWVKWSEMSEWMELTWNNPMEKSLWSIEGVPIKVTWDEWKSMSLSKWMDSMRFEWNEWIEVNRGEMSDLMD